MDEIFIGIAIVSLVVVGYKTLKVYRYYKLTMYPELYSGFIEFLLKKGNPYKMSQSTWYENNFGYHKIFHCVDLTNKKPVNVIVLIFKNGIYFINSKNIKGILKKDKHKRFVHISTIKENKIISEKVTVLPDILEESKYIEDKINKLTHHNCIHSYVTVLDDCEIKISNHDIEIVHQKDFFHKLQNSIKSSKAIFDENDIDFIYQELVNGYN